MAIAAIAGSGLGLMVWQQRPGMGETLLWGMVYGTLWWFIGSLTLFPLFLGLPGYILFRRGPLRALPVARCGLEVPVCRRGRGRR